MGRGVLGYRNSGLWVLRGVCSGRLRADGLFEGYIPCACAYGCVVADAGALGMRRVCGVLNGFRFWGLRLHLCIVWVDFWFCRGGVMVVVGFWVI